MLKDKIAFVTGGSGDVGEAIVKVLARENCKVAFSYNKGQHKAETLEKKLNSSGFYVKSYCLDVTDAKASSELSRQIEEEIGFVEKGKFPMRKGWRDSKLLGILKPFRKGK